MLQPYKLIASTASMWVMYISLFHGIFFPDLISECQRNRRWCQGNGMSLKKRIDDLTNLSQVR
jgi:membrane glycosyltransferase